MLCCCRTISADEIYVIQDGIIVSEEVVAEVVKVAQPEYNPVMRMAIGFTRSVFSIINSAFHLVRPPAQEAALHNTDSILQ